MKKIVLIIVPLMVIGGTVVGLGMAGIVNIPGLTKKKAKPPVLYGEEKDKSKQPSVKSPKPVPEKKAAAPEEPNLDPAKGAKKVAQLWNNIGVEQLTVLTKEFSEDELALIFAAMDPEKVAAVLAALDPKRSAKLSKALAKVASVVPKAD